MAGAAIGLLTETTPSSTSALPEARDGDPGHAHPARTSIAREVVLAAPDAASDAPPMTTKPPQPSSDASLARGGVVLRSPRRTGCSAC